MTPPHAPPVYVCTACGATYAGHAEYCNACGGTEFETPHASPESDAPHRPVRERVSWPLQGVLWLLIVVFGARNAYSRNVVELGQLWLLGAGASLCLGVIARDLRTWALFSALGAGFFAVALAF